MTDVKPKSEKSIFLRALELESDRERADYLESACGDDSELRAGVEALVEANHRSENILDALCSTEPFPYSDGCQLSDDRDGKQMGDFRIIREIGRGGMGVVFEAQQLSLNRRVALKVLGFGEESGRTAIARFHSEAEAAAMLHHSNIVPIYATGKDQGTYYFAMELVPGPSLREVIERLSDGSPTGRIAGAEESTYTGRSLPSDAPVDRSIAGPDDRGTPLFSDKQEHFQNIANSIAEVADALHHAHSRNVIHRDIKPANLLVSQENRLVVTDFGLARMAHRPGVTLPGEFVGSPLYVSPEQIAAGRIPIDHRTDIYSLGATLYELLTLRPPFPGSRTEEVIAQILQKEPKLPRGIDHRIPIDLQTISVVPSLDELQ